MLAHLRSLSTLSLVVLSACDSLSSQKMAGQAPQPAPQVAQKSPPVIEEQPSDVVEEPKEDHSKKSSAPAEVKPDVESDGEAVVEQPTAENFVAMVSLESLAPYEVEIGTETGECRGSGGTNLIVLIKKQGKVLSRYERKTEFHGALCDDRTLEFLFHDLNFDGHGDFMVPFERTGQYGTMMYWVFLFEPKKRTFEPSMEFSHVTGAHDFKVKKGDKTLLFYIRHSVSRHQYDTYDILEGQPRHRESASYTDHNPFAGPDECWTELEITYPDGRPTRTSKHDCNYREHD